MNGCAPTKTLGVLKRKIATYSVDSAHCFLAILCMLFQKNSKEHEKIPGVN